MATKLNLTLLDQSQSTSESSVNSMRNKRLIKRTSRSNSSKTSHSRTKQMAATNFGNFYVKNVNDFNQLSTITNPQNLHAPIMRNRQKQSDQSPKKQTKRRPTPSKSYKQIGSNSVLKRGQGRNDADDVFIERDMQIHQLQKKLDSEKRVRQIYEMKSKQFEIQVVIQAKKNKALQKQIKQLKAKDKEQKQRISTLEKNIDKSNTQIKTTKNNLQKLKFSIKQSRCQQFEIQIKELNVKYQAEIQKNSKITQLNNSLQKQVADLMSQLENVRCCNQANKMHLQMISQEQTLRAQIKKLKSEIQEKKTEKQIFLEKSIVQFESHIISLKEINKKITIEMNFLNRKKMEELQILKKKKQQQIKFLRNKYSALLDKYKELRQRPFKDKKSEIYFSLQVENNTRRNRFSQLCSQCGQSTRKNDDEMLNFSLSPDFKI